ncbi:MAG: ferrochelatase [Gammaproteobacteria bacterium]|nr:ferrochelatase [Gammaproteobacteria bacterium]
MGSHVKGLKNYQHGQTAKTGIILVNLGTPEAPTAPALRKYLAEFLSDTRVVEIPKLLWMMILHGIILRVRPAKSAKAYARVWSEDGSPLMAGTKALANKLAAKFKSDFSNDSNEQLFVVDFAMRYGQPSVASVLNKLQQNGVQKFIIVPLYPQYSGATSGSVADAVFKELLHWRWVPALHLLGSYHDDDNYIDSLVKSIKTHWQKEGQPQKLLISFHGMPKGTLEKGDPYFCHCHKTARLMAQKLELSDEQWEMAFQSRFGKAEWLKPYFAERIEKLPKEGVKDIQVVCPGFSIDCLETLDEINIEGRSDFLNAGGEKFSYIPALNSSDEHINFHFDRILQLISAWPESKIAPEELLKQSKETIKYAQLNGGK